VRDVPIGSLAAVPHQPVILGRDPDGLYAMTAICTHQGCDMTSYGSITFSVVSCDCHGSRFGRNGDVLKGPADVPLDHYRVDVALDGTITVQASVIVSASTRTPASPA
jgi:Rieske Fe-S protein